MRFLLSFLNEENFKTLAWLFMLVLVVIAVGQYSLWVLPESVCYHAARHRYWTQRRIISNAQEYLGNEWATRELNIIYEVYLEEEAECAMQVNQSNASGH